MKQESEKEPCVGRSKACKGPVSPDAPWGRVVFDGVTRFVCGSVCNEKFYADRFKRWEEYVPGLAQGAAD